MWRRTRTPGAAMAASTEPRTRGISATAPSNPIGYSPLRLRRSRTTALASACRSARSVARLKTSAQPIWSSPPPSCPSRRTSTPSGVSPPAGGGSADAGRGVRVPFFSVTLVAGSPSAASISLTASANPWASLAPLTLGMAVTSAASQSTVLSASEGCRVFTVPHTSERLNSRFTRCTPTGSVGGSLPTGQVAVGGGPAPCAMAAPVTAATKIMARPTLIRPENLTLDAASIRVSLPTESREGEATAHRACRLDQPRRSHAEIPHGFWRFFCGRRSGVPLQSPMLPHKYTCCRIDSLQHADHDLLLDLSLVVRNRIIGISGGRPFRCHHFLEEGVPL